MKQNIMQTITKYSTTAAVALFSLSLQSCSESPDRFFAITVLNTNTVVDFATPKLARHIDDETKEFENIPATKNKGDDALTFVNNKIAYIEKTRKDIKALNADSDDRKTIKDKALALYDFVIPIYKNEYTNYAKLCDSKADEAQKEEAAKLIDQKYSAKFEQMYFDLLDSGKAFANENNIKINW